MDKKDKASGRVWQKRTFELDQLRIGCEMLIKESQRLLAKVEKEGIDSNYSINSDVLRWARQAHSACYSLSVLRECQVYIDEEHGIIRKLGKENQHGSKDQTTAPRPADGGSPPEHSCSSREGAGGVLQERGRPEAVETPTTSNCRQAQEGQQECVPRPSGSLTH